MSTQECENLNRQQKFIRLYLAKVAARRDMVTYTKLCRDCHLPYAMENPYDRGQLGHDLGVISWHEVELHNRPMLSSVTVSYSGGSARPGNGFFDLASELKIFDNKFDNKFEFFIEEMKKTYEFWTSIAGKKEIAKFEKEISEWI